MIDVNQFQVLKNKGPFSPKKNNPNKTCQRPDGFGFKSNFLKKITVEDRDLFKNEIPQNKDFHSECECKKNNFYFQLNSQYEKDALLADYLQYLSGSILNQWKIVFCVLAKTKLYCFEDHHQNNLLLCLDFNVFEFKTAFKQLSFQLRINDQSAPYIFKTYSHNQIHLWKLKLQTIFKKPSVKAIIFRENRKASYIGKDIINESFFINHARTGDIILLESKNYASSLQRIVTNSDYDHVALIVKFGDKDIGVLSSNPGDGVTLANWNNYRSKLNSFEKVSVKRLNLTIDGEKRQKFTKFIKQIIGKKYQIGVLKLMRKYSDQEQTRGYFCSELVAKSLKILGILSNTKASSRYWPIDFTDRGDLELHEDCFYKNEQSILLSSHIQ